MKLSLSFLPKNDKFFFMLHQSTMNIQQVARRFQDLMDDFCNVEAKVEEMTAALREGISDLEEDPGDEDAND